MEKEQLEDYVMEKKESLSGLRQQLENLKEEEKIIAEQLKQQIELLESQIHQLKYHIKDVNNNPEKFISKGGCGGCRKNRR